MPKSSSLEVQLTVVAQEFVARIVEVLRGASFDEVAQLAASGGRPRASAAASRPRAEAAATSPAPQRTAAATTEAPTRTRRPRQSADRRAELGERILSALKSADAPLGVRALSSELGVATDVLATPLKELRAEGRIVKHGEKRATSYSVGR